MTTAIKCETCGKYVRKERYRKHLQNEHGAGQKRTDPSFLPLSKQGAAKPSGRLSAPATGNGGITRAPAPLNRPRRVHPSVPLPGQRVSHRVTAFLEPSQEQRTALDQIFLAPEFCLYLLLTHQPVIRTRSDAQMFLLRYKGEIDKYLPPHNRSKLIDLLYDFILEWAKRVPSQIRLEFDCHIVRHENDSYARVGGLGDIFLDHRSIRGELPPPTVALNAMIAKQQEDYSLAFVYESTSSEPVPTAARVWYWDHHDEPQVAMPPLKPRPDGKTRKRKAEQGIQAPLRTKLVLSSPRIARPARARAVQLEPCPLCGTGVERGGMLMHKHEAHGESLYSPSPTHTPRRYAWVMIYQGGAPGLGKGKS